MTEDRKSRITALRVQFEGLVKKAKAKEIGWTKDNPDELMPEEIANEIDGYLGKSDEIRVELDRLSLLEGAEQYLTEPEGTPKAAFHGTREVGPTEGLPEVDLQSWRSLKVAMPLANPLLPWTVAEKEIRYYVPIAVQDKDYPSAFEVYLRKGYRDMGPNDQKTLTEGVDTAGGFLVPADYNAEMIKKIAQQAVIRGLARVVSTSRDVAEWPKITYTTDDIYTSGVRLTWTGESPATATTHRVTDPVFGLHKIPVHTAMASLPLSNDLLEDAVFDVFGVSSGLISEAFALGEDDVFLNGNGATRPKGILANVDGTDEITSVVSGDANLLKGDGIIDLFYAVPSQYRMRGVWVMASNTMRDLEKLVDSQGRYLVSSMLNASLAIGTPDAIKGRPVRFDEFMPSIAAGNFPILFGDFSAYMIVERTGLSIQRLSELYAETNISLLLARRRVGGDTVEPWRLKAQKISA